MDTLTKEKLAMTRDGDQFAASVRLKAARIYSGLSQDELGAKVNITKATVSNIEKCRSYPSRALMTYFHREHRIDFNFMIHGDYAQLPSDVQDRLFPILEAVHSEMGPKPN
jgi:DNA-binding XRE family transcriptional regulator